MYSGVYKKSKNIRFWTPPFLVYFLYQFWGGIFLAFQQLHAGKVKLNGIAGIQHHLIDRNRVKTNPDINLSRSNLNYSIEDLSPKHLVQRVNFRIQQLKLKKRPRSDAVGLEDVIVGASSDFMLQLGAEKQEKYFTDTLHFFQKRYGKENVMYCQCHLDESNPHIHIGIVPVTSDDRLSARDVFNPKSLEKLQTDFHCAVSSHYGLERGEHHAKTYLEVNKFKAQQAQRLLQQYTDDLNTALLQQDTIDTIQKSTHFATTGTFFKTQDKEKIELPTKDFLLLKQVAVNGIKAKSYFQLIQQQNKTLQREKLKALADYDCLLQKFNHLQNTAKPYTQIPPYWRKNIDKSIDSWQKFFINYCHDLNRATVRVFIATHGNYDKTSNIMKPLFENISIFKPKHYVKNVISSALSQFKSKSKPSNYSPSWQPPSFSNTDYQKSDDTGIIPLQLSNVPDINWEMINWDLLSELDKDDIRHQQLMHSL